MSIILFLLLALLLLASAFFSGTEAAFFSLNRVQLRRMERDSHRRSRRVLRVLARPWVLLTRPLAWMFSVPLPPSPMLNSVALVHWEPMPVTVAVPVEPES